MSPIRKARHGALAVALGLGLAVSAGPAVASADDTESAPADSPAPVSKRGTPARAQDKPLRSAGEPNTRRRPAAVTSPIPAPAATIGARAVRATRLVVTPVAAATPVAESISPTTTLDMPEIAPRATAAVAPAATVMTAAGAALPSGAATGTALNPLEVFTAALAMISREINRLFFNRTPIANPVQYALRTPAVATGTIGGSDPEDDPLSYSITGAPAHGSVVIDSAGGYTYTANPDLATTGGTDSFAVTVRDTGFHLNFWTPTSISVPVTVTVTAAAPTGPTVPTAPVAPRLSIGDARAAEGNGEMAHFMFMVELDTVSTAAVTVGFATSSGTATAGVDYAATSGTLVFAPGVQSQMVHVEILGDTVHEPDETITVTLSNPSGASIAAASALGTIVDDDGSPALTPGLSVSDASAPESRSGGIAAGFLHTSGNQILDSAGHPVQISGINWFGLESSNGAPHGLWTRGYQDMIDQMAAEGFNTIRLPYASETLHTSAAPNEIDFSKNLALQGLSSVQLMDAIIDYAGQKGMRVILDHHRSGFGSGTSGSGLWYEGSYTEDAWVADWAMLADRYKDDPTVIGFDLHNEPYNGTWGGGGATDWARAAERAGNAALAVNPDLLVFVEGVANYQGQSYWWGGNLAGVADRPIVLSVPARVVYSPHDYPNSVYPQPWFASSDFAAVLPAKFRQMWGYIYENNVAPVYLGEFGTKLQDPKDVAWFEAITSYLSGDLDNNGTIDIPSGTEDFSWTYWSWNPNSGDTGGILADDWHTINTNKMAYLTPIEFSGTAVASVLTFTVSLSAPSTTAVSVRYSTADGTATAGADYTAAAGTITFAPGETRQTITVSVLSDSLTETTEDLHLMLSTPSGATLADAMGMGSITAPGSQPTAPVTPTTPVTPTVPAPTGDFVDLMTFGMFHGSDHTGSDGLEGGRTAITTEALLAYNNLRRFTGLAPATLEDVGRWAFANGLTNNTEAWDNDLQGVGLYYAMQGAKVGWIAADKYDPQIVADIERTARLGSAADVMAMVATYGRPGFAAYLTANGYQSAFIDTVKMEPHYAGWMHDRANGRLVIEGAATAHDLNHLTVLSHDQLHPFMNDTWDWPQWPALEVSDAAVIRYYQSMVTLGDPRAGLLV